MPQWPATNGWLFHLIHLWLPPRSLHLNPRLQEECPLSHLLLLVQWPSPKPTWLPSQFQHRTPLHPLQANPHLTSRWGLPNPAHNIKPRLGSILASSRFAAPHRCSTCLPSPKVPTLLMDHHSPASLQWCIRNSNIWEHPKEVDWVPEGLTPSWSKATNLQAPRRPTSQMSLQA